MPFTIKLYLLEANATLILKRLCEKGLAILTPKCFERQPPKTRRGLETFRENE